MIWFGGYCLFSFAFFVCVLCVCRMYVSCGLVFVHVALLVSCLLFSSSCDLCSCSSNEEWRRVAIFPVEVVKHLSAELLEHCLVESLSSNLRRWQSKLRLDPWLLAWKCRIESCIFNALLTSLAYHICLVKHSRCLAIMATDIVWFICWGGLGQFGVFIEVIALVCWGSCWVEGGFCSKMGLWCGIVWPS